MGFVQRVRDLTVISVILLSAVATEAECS